METILITGSNGLIGNALVKLLNSNNNYRVIGVGRTVASDVEVVKADLSGDWHESQLPAKVDVLIHLAQSELFRDFPNSAEKIFNVNTYSTLKLLEYGRKCGVKKFIYASSGGVYGNSDIGFNEESPIQPSKDLGFYLTTKLNSELLVGNYQDFFEVNVLRFFFVYGERQKRTMLIPRLMDSVKQGHNVILTSNEGIKINPIYVEDAANAVLEVIKYNGSFNLNIGGSEIISIRKICEVIGDEYGKKPLFIENPSETKNLIGDISRLKKIYNPKISFNEGIKRMIEYGK